MILAFSDLPLTDLDYITSDSVGLLNAISKNRSDKILNALTSDRVVTTLFNDYVSTYSPITSQVGDEYHLCSDIVLNNFLLGA